MLAMLTDSMPKNAAPKTADVRITFRFANTMPKSCVIPITYAAAMMKQGGMFNHEYAYICSSLPTIHEIPAHQMRTVADVATGRRRVMRAVRTVVRSRFRLCAGCDRSPKRRRCR